MNKVALITGAGRGIGRGIALALAERGWSVVINYRGNKKAAEDVLRIATKASGNGRMIQADISQAADRRRLVAETLDHFGRLDLLVNNAGMAPRQRLDILEVGENSYDEVLAVNLKGPFFLTQRVARAMIELLGSSMIADPRIINISSSLRLYQQPQSGRILPLQSRPGHDDGPLRRPVGRIWHWRLRNPPWCD